jgi:hypothetical protein
MPSHGAPVDPGLEEIAAWHRWFVSGHTARLKDLNLPRDQYDAQLADIMRLGQASVETMREQYLANARRRS